MAKFNDATVVSLDPLETDRLDNGGHVVVEIDGDLVVLEGESVDFDNSDRKYNVDVEGIADSVTEQLHEAYKEEYSDGSDESLSASETLPEGASMGASSQTMLEKLHHAHGESASHTEKDRTPSFARSSAEIEEGDVVTMRGSEKRLRVVRVLDTPANVYLTGQRGENPHALAVEYPECDPSSNVALVRPEDDTGNPGDPIPVDALLLEERSS